MVTVNKILQLPVLSGIYYFLDDQGAIMYIGKATNLRSRVRSYFAGDMLEKRGPLIDEMIQHISHVAWQETDSALEALVLEAHLIKQHQPPRNSDGKSDRSFVYLIITREPFPRLLIKRHHDIVTGHVTEKIAYSFGPFSSRQTLEQALKIIRKIFPYYSRQYSYEEKSNLYQQMGLAPGTGMNRQEYKKNIQHIKLFFEGKKKRVVTQLQRQMMDYADRQEFEKADEIKKRIFALQHIRDVSLISDDAKHITHDGFRIEAYDVAHLAGTYAVGVMVVLYDGEPDKNEYRKFRIKSFDGIDDNRSLRELLERRLKHTEWEYPQLAVADGSVAQKKTVESCFQEYQISCHVVACKKDTSHKVAEILGDRAVIQKYRSQILLANSEAHRFTIEYHKQIREKQYRGKKKKK